MGWGYLEPKLECPAARRAGLFLYVFFKKFMFEPPVFLGETKRAQIVGFVTDFLQIFFNGDGKILRRGQTYISASILGGKASF